MGLSPRDVMDWMSTTDSITMLQTGEVTAIHCTNYRTQSQGRGGLDLQTRLHHHAAKRRVHSHSLHKQYDLVPGTWWSGCLQQASTTMLQTWEDTFIHYTPKHTHTQIRWHSTPGAWRARCTHKPPPPCCNNNPCKVMGLVNEEVITQIN